MPPESVPAALLVPPVEALLPLLPGSGVEVVPEVDGDTGAGAPESGVDEEQAEARPRTNAIAHPNESERIMRSL